MTMTRFFVDPHNITDFNRTQEQLETFWLFCIAVAGKHALTQAKKIAAFLEPLAQHAIYKELNSPFELIHSYTLTHDLMDALQKEKLGQYNKLIRSFAESLHLNLTTCTVNDLEEVYGVGPKTARFFLLHSRPRQRFAVLDTHILKWMKKVIDPTAPKITPPSGKRYAELERMYLEFCDENDADPAELDLKIWKLYNRDKVTA